MENKKLEIYRNLTDFLTKGKKLDIDIDEKGNPVKNLWRNYIANGFAGWVKIKPPKKKQKGDDTIIKDTIGDTNE